MRAIHTKLCDTCMKTNHFIYSYVDYSNLVIFKFQVLGCLTCLQLIKMVSIAKLWYWSYNKKKDEKSIDNPEHNAMVNMHGTENYNLRDHPTFLSWTNTYILPQIPAKIGIHLETWLCNCESKYIYKKKKK